VSEKAPDNTDTLDRILIGAIEDMVQIVGKVSEGTDSAGDRDAGNSAGDSAVSEKAPDNTDTLDRILIGAIEDMGQIVGKVSEGTDSAGDRRR
jgi:hypothetical protein